MAASLPRNGQGGTNECVETQELLDPEGEKNVQPVPQDTHFRMNLKKSGPRERFERDGEKERKREREIREKGMRAREKMSAESGQRVTGVNMIYFFKPFPTNSGMVPVGCY